MMKAITLILFAIVSSFTLVAADDIKPDEARDQILAKMRKKGSWEANLVGDLLEPFDQKALVQMATRPDADTGTLVRLILRAGAEKNARFQYLLGEKELRKAPEIDLALLAYDYSVNGNQKALESILSQHVKQVPPAEEAERSWESETVFVLGYVDEWNLTKKAMESHVLSGDGAGGGAQYAFWLTRRYLFPSNKQFPDDYEEFSEGVREQQKRAEQAGAGQPATRPESDSEGSHKPQPEAEGRSR